MWTTASIEFYDFCVLDRPHRVTGRDLRGTNRRFVESLDADFFSHVAETQCGYLNDNAKRQRAATMLRLCYRHALETFFSLTFATLQAPVLPSAWLSLCATETLKELVRACHKGTAPVFNQLELPQVTWRSIAGKILEAIDLPEDRVFAAADDFSRIWSILASDFERADAQAEYNALKHGMRCGFGGFRLAVASTPKNGETPAASDYSDLGGSLYGLHLHDFRKLSGRPNKDPSRILDAKYLNWDIDCTLARIGVLTHSIRNVVAFLNALSGSRDGSKACTLPTADQFRLARFEGTGVSHLTWHGPPDAPDATAEQVLVRLRTIGVARNVPP